MRPIAAPFPFLTARRAPIAKLCPASHGHCGLTVTTVFPGDNSLSTTHAQDLEGCQLGLHSKELITPPRPAWEGSECWVSLSSAAVYPLQASAAPAASTAQGCVCMGIEEREALQAVPTSRCTAVLCFPHSAWHMPLPSLDPFFFAES